jgi:hypothetical protein
METITTKTIKELTAEDKLLRLYDNELYSLNEIITDTSILNPLNKKTYFYFKNMGLVRDILMKRMFKISEDKFVIYK